VLTTVLNTADTITGWTAGTTIGSSDVLSISVGAVNAELAGPLTDGNGNNIAAGDAVVFDPIITGASTLTGNILLLSANNIAGVNSLLQGATAGVGGSQSLTFAFIDNNNDLNFGVASVLADAGGLILSSSANVTQVFQGTYTLAGLADTNFSFVA
jgi:hypothetical protein